MLSVVHAVLEEPSPTRFVLTGSSARKLRRGDVNLLGGRALHQTLHPFMAAELPDFDPGFTIRRSVDGSFVVSGARIERAAAMTYWDHDEAVLRFQHILETLGVSGGLESAGVQAGDTVYIGEYELEWSE